MPEGPILLNILWRSDNLIGPEEDTSLINYAPILGLTFHNIININITNKGNLVKS